MRFFAINPATGKIQWHFEDANFKDPNHKEYPKHGAMTNNGLWNGGLFNKLARYNMDGPTADRAGSWTGTGNMRCVRTGLANYLIRGFTGYMGADGTGYQTYDPWKLFDAELRQLWRGYQLPMKPVPATTAFVQSRSRTQADHIFSATLIVWWFHQRLPFPRPPRHWTNRRLPKTGLAGLTLVRRAGNPGTHAGWCG